VDAATPVKTEIWKINHVSVIMAATRAPFFHILTAISAAQVLLAETGNGQGQTEREKM
jgi:hypothetical protein